MNMNMKGLASCLLFSTSNTSMNSFVYLRFVQAVTKFKQAGNTTNEAWTIVKKIKFIRLEIDNYESSVNFCNNNLRSYSYIAQVVEDFVDALGLSELEMTQPHKFDVSDNDMIDAGDMFIYLTSCSKSALFYTRFNLHILIKFLFFII